MFARAKHLAEAPGPVRIARGKKQVTYYHLMCDAHEIIFANGAMCESFYPGDFALEMYSAQDIAQIKKLIPDLGVQPVTECYGPAARRFLRRKDVLKFVDLRTKSDADTRVAAE